MSNKKNVCVLQFTRMGDILQTYQSLLNVNNENINLILIARKKFAQPIEALLKEVFSEIIYFDTKEIFDGFQLDEVDGRLAELVSTINGKSIDLLVNLSFSPSSGYLASMIKSRIKFGLSYNTQNNIAIPDKWSQYIYSNVLTGSYNSFSLVDLFAMMIGNPNTKERINPIEKKNNTIIVHPFASTEKKKWKSLRWAELLHYILENNKDSIIELVGAANEKEQSDEIVNTPLLFKFRNRIKNLCGTTNLVELNQRVASSKLFIGHDSMVGHLASINNIRSLTISLGTVRPEESSPYGERNLIFVPQTKCFPCQVSDKCETLECHADLSYKIVGKFAAAVLDNPEVDYQNVAATIPKSLFYTSCIVYESALSENSLYTLKEVTAGAPNIKSVIKQISRITWLYFLEEKEEKNKLPFVDGSVKAEVKNYLSAISNLYELSEFGKKYSKYILEELSKDNPSTESLRKLSAQLDEIEMLQKALKKPYPELSALLDYFAVTRGNTAGESIVELTTNTFFLYNDASLICSIFYELLEKVINQNANAENKPVERN